MDTYPYRAYLENPLMYRGDTKNTHLDACVVWKPDLADAQSLSLVKDTVLPVKGSSFGMSCILSTSFISKGITLYKNGIEWSTCLGSSHNCVIRPGMILKANLTGVFITISSLDRDSHEGTWTCAYSTGSTNINSNAVNLTVYTLPSGIRVTQEPSENVDLSIISATFQCETMGCSYPDPVIQWMYEDLDGASGIQTETSNICTQPEKIYTSTLVIQRNSTLSDNSDKIVIVSCRINYPDSSISIIASATKSVRFAVAVTAAVLKHNNQIITDVLTVNLGEPATLTCMTGLSRPDPTVDWYIGSKKRGSGPSLNFTPSNADHEEIIYCQAYNTDPNRIVYSVKPRLFVQVRVTEAVLQQNNQNITDMLTVISGKLATLICMTGFSRPDPSIDWYIGSQKRGSGPGLNFTPNNSDHNQIIYCQAYNTDPNRIVYSLKPRLSVQVDVSTVTLEPPGDTITFLDGTVNTLRCTTSPSRPQPVISWWLDINEVTNLSNTMVTETNTLFFASSILHLTLEKTQQGKKVYCDAKVNGQADAVDSTKPAISVWYQPSSPSVQTFQGNFPWLENQTGALQCMTADYGNPKASVIWTSSSGSLDMNTNLVLRNLSVSDHGQPVYCQVQNNFTAIKGLTIVSPTITLNVEYRPIITLNPSVQPLRIKEGSNLTVTCMASGNPQPIVQWKNRNPPGNTLHIPSILRNSTGSYTCVASSTSTNYNRVLLQREKSTRVIVEYAPDVRVNISGYAVVGSSAVLMCTPQGEPPQYTFHLWIHAVGQTEIRRLAGVTMFGFSTLPLSNISIQDMGTYICTVDNSITGLDGHINQTGDTRVYFQGPPVIGETQSTFTGETDKSACIKIPFYSNSSIMTMKFSKQLDSFEISNTSDISIYISPSNITMMFYNKKVTIPGHVAVLYFRNLTERDFSNYTLQLSNDQGNISMKFDFISSAPPSVPKNFFFSHIEDGVLVFGIEKGFNGGHEQTFIVEYQPFEMPDATWSTVFRINETDLDNTSINGIYYIKIPKIQDGQYIFRVYAENRKGISSTSEGVYAETKTDHPSPRGNMPVAGVAGGVVGAILVLIAIAAVAIIVKRRTLKPKTEGLQMNPVYDSSGLAVQESAKVTKPKKMFGQTEDPSKLYAQVDKTNTKKGKRDVYENTPLPLKSSFENVYENPGHLAADPNSSENVYENPEASASKGQLVNKGGLLYADLILGLPTTKAGKPVIHGLDNRTEYAEIAYGKRGEPLPETDEVQSGGAAKLNTYE